MTIPILRTKLFKPALRPSLVQRQRLLDKLEAGLAGTLNLISAPAGFGKTTLAVRWIAQTDLPAAWLSLDVGDSDLTVFLSYIIAAIQSIEEEVAQSGGPQSPIGAQALEMLQGSQPTATSNVLAALLNDISSINRRFTLVLDDYHVLDAPAVDGALSFLLDHQPPQMHMVITTREDPNLPLARLRVRNQLMEVRAADLRFTNNEARAFLKDVMRVELSDEDINALESRTEGWVAGLQMAALSMQGRSDHSQFIQAFTGSNRFVLDYLLEEVLQQQPEKVRDFLLQTSILERLTGPLCHQVTGQEESAAMLELLERANLFVIPIDDQRQWYRYHHLFAEVLQARLLKERAAHENNDENLVTMLHQRASAWYAEHALIPQAIHHALAAQNFERAAELIAQVWRAYDRSNQNAQVQAWLDALPEALIASRADLCTANAWRALYHNDFEVGETWLTRAESLEHTPANEAVPLPAIIAGARAYLAQARGDFSGSIQFAERSLELLSADDFVERSIAASLLGLASWAEGDLETTYRSFSDVQNGFRKGGEDDDANEIGYILADLRRAQGRLRLAKKGYEQSLKFAQAIVESGRPAPRGMASFYMGLGEIYCEMGDFTEAEAALDKSEVLGPSTGLEDWRHRFCMAQARLTALQGNLDGALHLLDKAEERYYQSPLPNVRPISALRARIWIRQGRFAEVHQWAANQGLSPDAELSYLQEFEQITLARFLLAQAKNNQSDEPLSQAMDLLDRLYQFAEKGKRIGHTIEIRLQQALACETQGDEPSACTALEDALLLAEPEGYIAHFIEEEASITKLLHLAASRGAPSQFHNYVAQVLEPVDDAENIPRHVSQSIIEPLSDRELEVLRLIAAGRKNQEIADELIISLNTVRYHTKNIYGKLGVNKRTQAVAQSQTLGLL